MPSKTVNSTFYRDRGVPEFLTQDIDEECGWAWSEIRSFVDEEGNELIGSTRYVAPDDGNPYDESVLKIELTNPVLPNTFQRFQMQWEAKIPKTMPRTGYNKEFYFFAQWFPKIGVYEPAGMRYKKSFGAWNCHQYHSSGEYYSDFGVYNVHITVPEGFVVAATGELVGQDKKSDQRTWHFLAEDVIDFAWSASPQFVVQEDQFNDTEIRLYSYPYKAGVGERYLTTVKHSMAYLEEHFEAYPYPTLSIIDPPIHGMFTGGMEYPTLITSLSFCFFPKGIRTPEILVVHEFIHQYFMQMVATHEVEDPWMDEGITTYYECRILDDLFGPRESTIDVLGFKAGNTEYNRIEFLASDNIKIAPNSFKSWEFKHGGYGYISYNKAALWLTTLEGIIGIELMDEIMREYFMRWKFKHPCRDDFVDVVNEVILEKRADEFPDGMDWFFDQVIYGTDECDYAVASIENRKKGNPRGFFDNLDQCEEMPSDTVSKWHTRVLFHRLGELRLPVECVVHFEDGSTYSEMWDGVDRSFEIHIDGSQKIVSAYVDPERKIYIDSNFLNNSRTTKDQGGLLRQFTAHVVTTFQHLLETISLWV